LLLLAVVASVVLVAFRTLLPKTHDIAGDYYNIIANGIMEDSVAPAPPPPPTAHCQRRGELPDCPSIPRFPGCDNTVGCRWIGSDGCVGCCYYSERCDLLYLHDEVMCKSLQSCEWVVN